MHSIQKYNLRILLSNEQFENIKGIMEGELI